MLFTSILGIDFQPYIKIGRVYGVKVDAIAAIKRKMIKKFGEICVER